MALQNLPSSWATTKLEKISSDISYGYTAKGSNDDIGPRMLRITDIHSNRVNWNSVPYCAISEKDLDKYLLEKGDLLFARTGATVGKSFLIREEIPASVYASYLIRVRCHETMNTSFLAHYFRGPEYWEQITDLSAGIGQPNVNGSKLKGLLIPMPPFTEQKIIAQKLDTLLAQVESTKVRLERTLGTLKRFRQSVLAAAVSGKLTEEWRVLSGVHISDWNHTSVGGLATVATGKTPKRTESKYWRAGTIPWLTSASTGAEFTVKAEQFVTEQAVQECTLKLFQPGTLLMAMYGEGKTRGQVTEITIQATCNQACAAILVDERNIFRKFMKLRLIENYEETRKAAAGGAQPNLNLNKVREIPVHLPSTEEQTEIVRRVEQLFSHASIIEKQTEAALTKVSNLTQSILAKAFRGELTEQWRKDNPELISGENSAEALLEKIKAERAAAKPKRKTRKKA